MKKINSIVSYIKKISKENIGVSILGIVVFVFLVFSFVYLLRSRSVSEIEKRELDNKTSNLVYYLDDLVDSKSKQVDKYIIFALDYNYNVNSKNNMTVKELVSFIKDYFVIDITKSDIKNVGITEDMIEKNIVYDSNKELFTMKEIKKSGTTIANEKIVFYVREKIVKVNKKKYKLTYRRYIVENPYDILNYYLDNNNKNNESFDVTPIRNYLMGSSKISSLKNVINEKDISKFGKKDKKIKVTYVVENDNIKISKIK
ncbi:MAG: hypothetical protein IKF37_01610 [Bacilli bacterium]|nr:hypothetical protein [Bacilli bacterium]